MLLPFELADNTWQTKSRNRFVTDLYAGLRLAQDSLQRAGRLVQLAYDTRGRYAHAQECAGAARTGGHGYAHRAGV
ncbi:MAG: hypothetical protein WKG07_05420 [Hymenobacter sp.]